MKKVIIGILISIISIVLVYFSIKDINLSEVSIALKKIQWSYVVYFFLLVILMQWLRSYRWGVILQPMEKIDQLSLFSVTSVGFLAISAIPARIGELARPFLIARRSSIKMSSALGTILVERVLDGFSVLVIALIVLVLFGSQLPPNMINSGIIFFLMAFLILCFIVFSILRRETALKFINRIFSVFHGKFAHKIDEMAHHLIDSFQIVTDIKLLLYLLFLSALVWIVDVLAIHVLLLAFGFNLPIIASCVVMVFLIAGIAIPTVPGYIGNWHLACIAALNLFSLTKAQTFSFAVFYHFLSMVIVVILGFAFLPFNKFSISDMKKQMNY